MRGGQRSFVALLATAVVLAIGLTHRVVSNPGAAGASAARMVGLRMRNW